MTQQDAQTAPPPAPTATPPKERDRFLLAIVVGTILLIVASVVIVLVMGRPRPAAPADPSSPAGVVQSYIEAYRAGDVEKSRGYLTREARAQALARDRNDSYSPSFNDNVRLVVENTEMTDTTAEVKVTVSRFYARSDPFSSSTSHRDVTVRLVKEDGEWRITQAIPPYSFT